MINYKKRVLDDVIEDYLSAFGAVVRVKLKCPHILKFKSPPWNMQNESIIAFIYSYIL